MKKNSTLMKKITCFALSLLMALGFVPVFAFAKETTLATKVDLPNPGFSSYSSTSSNPTAWTSNIGEVDKDAFTIGGRISANPLFFESSYEGFVNTWLSTWKTNHSNLTLPVFNFFEDATSEAYVPKTYSDMTSVSSTEIIFSGNTFDVDASDSNLFVFENSKIVLTRRGLEEGELDTISNNLKLELMARIPNIPSIPNIENSTNSSDFNVLMLNAGYKIEVNDVDNFTLSDKEVFFTFTQTVDATAVSVEAFNYYRASIYANTLESAANALFKINNLGDDAEFFSDISTTNISSNVYKYIFHETESSDTISFISSVNPTDGAEIFYDGVKFVYDTLTSKAIPAVGSSYITFDEDISLTTGWKQYTLYFSLRKSAEITFTIGLGSSNDDKSTGVVFFDDLSLEKVTYSEFDSIVTTESTKIAKNLRTTTHTDVTSLTLVSEENGTDITTVTNSTDSNVSVADGSIIKVNHYNSGNVSYEIKTFSAQRMKYSRVGFWIKSMDLSSAFTLTLSGDIQGNPSSNQSVAIASSAVNEWQLYYFYILSSPYQDTDLSAQIKFTSSGTHYIGGITIDDITSEEYLNGASNKLALNTTAYSKNITNGYFTTYVNQNETSTQYYPQGWNFVSDGFKFFEDSSKSTLSDIKFEDVTLDKKVSITYDGNTYAYIAEKDCYEFFNPTTNLTQKIVALENISYEYNLEKDSLYNSTIKCLISNDIATKIVFVDTDLDGRTIKNALSISSTDDVFQGLVSSAIKISSGNTNFISVFAKVPALVNAQIILLGSDNKELISQEIVGDGTWQEYKIYIRGGSSDKTVYLSLCIGSDTAPSTGEVLFANIAMNTAYTFDSVLKTKVADMTQTRILDFATENFTGHKYTNSIDGIFSSTTLNVVDSPSAGKYGVLDIHAASSYLTQFGAKIVSYDNDSNSRVLIIDNNSSQKTTLESKFSTVLNSSAYYKVTVLAKTLKLAEKSNFSLSFIASNGDRIIDENFSSIDTSKFKNDDTNDFETYTFYISTGTFDFENFNVRISLAGEGIILLGKIDIAKSDKDSFTTATKSEDGKTKFVDFTSNSSTTADKTEDEKEEETEQEDRVLMIFFIVFSSLLLVAATVVAVVFAGVKKLPKRKVVKINKKFNRDKDSEGFV